MHGKCVLHAHMFTEQCVGEAQELHPLESLLLLLWKSILWQGHICKKAPKLRMSQENKGWSRRTQFVAIAWFIWGTYEQKHGVGWLQDTPRSITLQPPRSITLQAQGLSTIEKVCICSIETIKDNARTGKILYV